MNRDEQVDRLLRRTSAPDADARPAGVCLDAETLACWSDGSLTARERELAETHTADCGRCLEALAALARAVPAHTAVPWWSRWFSWRWVVPITASAVAVTLWVAVARPELQPAVPDAPQSIAAAPPAPPAPNRFDESASAALAARTASGQAAPSPTASKRVAEPKEDASAKASQAAADAQTSTAAAAAPLELPAVAPAPTGAPVLAPPGPLREELRQSALRERRAASIEIISPHSTVRWRVAGTSVEQSIDSGRTWVATRPTGTAATLVGGSSPSRNVCWLVGGGGTVLLTTDAASWRRLPFPETTDLAAVTAVNAETATVTTVDGRTYRTVDAGRTWTLQETPSTPF